MAQSKFAMRMLEKQGWKEGDGLGKNRDGISKPIKAFMKRDKAGVGQDLGTDLTDHWWLRVFNDAAKSNTTKTIEVPEVKQNPPLQNRLYAGFRKGSTLKQGKEEKDSDCNSEDEREPNLESSDLPTLDDIHKYCGGATGHRAATLGIKMTGKLKRAAEHERLFNERVKDKTKTSANSDDKLNGIDTTVTSMKRKKKHNKKAENLTEVVESTSSKNSCEDKCVESSFNDGESSDLSNGVDVISDNAQGEKMKKKKNKKMKRKREEHSELSAQCLEDTCSVKKRKKSKSKDKNRTHSVHEENSESIFLDTNKHLKRNKKKKHKDSVILN